MLTKLSKPSLQILIFSFAYILCFTFNANGQQTDVVQYVQPLAGTASSTTPGALKHGDGTELNANTIPAVGLPFGMTQWTPQTRESETKCLPPYFYKDQTMNGFRASHWLSGSCTQDYGSFTLMPISGHLQTDEKAYRTKFAHEDEITKPYYYSLKLPAYQLQTEITASLRAGMLRITSQKTDSLYLLIKPNSDQGKGFVKVDRARSEIYGYNPAHRIYQGWGEPAGFSGYFVIKIDRKILVNGVFSADHLSYADSIINEKNIGAFIGFKLKKGEQIHVRVGTSFSSLAGARKNLSAEMPDFNFDEQTAKHQRIWQRELSRIKVTTEVVKDKRVFYTALYHAMQQPRLFNDVDGIYPQFAGNYQLKKMPKGNYYDDFSMWDIYRAQLPLFEFLKPDLISDFLQSITLKGNQGGWLPIFPCWNNYTAAMIGDHSTAFIASAYTKGIRGFDVQEAYRLMRQNAFDSPDRTKYVDGKGRRALVSYLKYGYIPMQDSVPDAFHKKEQVSRTLEYAYDDYALAMVAKGLGKTADYLELAKRSMNYKNVFDPKVGMMRGRNADRTWFEPFRPTKKEPYITEGTPQQYSFYVPQDVNGLASLMGGKKALEASLDQLFEKGEYWHGNEPGHQIPFLYNYTGSPWKTQQYVNEILTNEYSDGPGGLSGNDDAGQMSAWYVFAAIGFYQVDPVSDQYLLTAPRFDQITITLPKSKKFQIIAHRQSKKSVFIASLKLNGKGYRKNYLRYADLMAGGKLEFFLQNEPKKDWAIRSEDQPKGWNDRPM